MSTPFVSVIVPSLNDDATLADLLASFRGGPECDVTIAAVGTQLSDARTADGSPVRWVDTTPGRARQMNDGARHARGKWLLFLHADTRLASAWLSEIQAIDAAGRAVAGCFRFRLDSNDWRARLIEWGAGIRAEWLRLPYGDQALFVRKSVFDAIGGFRELPFMEDVDFVRRVRRAGTLAISPLCATTSARRWERDGWFARSAMNVLLVVLFCLGVSPERLVRWYHADDSGS